MVSSSGVPAGSVVRSAAARFPPGPGSAFLAGDRRVVLRPGLLPAVLCRPFSGGVAGGLVADGPRLRGRGGVVGPVLVLLHLLSPLRGFTSRGRRCRGSGRPRRWPRSAGGGRRRGCAAARRSARRRRG